MSGALQTVLTSSGGFTLGFAAEGEPTARPLLRSELEAVLADLNKANALAAENDKLRQLLAELRNALVRAGWHDDAMLRRVKAASQGLLGYSAPNGGGV